VSDADRPTRPPLTRSLQKFLCGIQLPPAPKKGPNPNKDYALLLNALAWHASGVTENAESITCSPSMRQVAEIMHCSTRTVQRSMHELQSLGFIRIRRRGNHLANIFTVYQTVRRSDTTTVVQSKRNNRHDNSRFRPDNSAVQTRQLESQTRQQLSSSGVDLQDSKRISGVVLQGQAKTKAALSFKDKNQNQNQSQGFTDLARMWASIPKSPAMESPAPKRRSSAVDEYLQELAEAECREECQEISEEEEL
jgi:DNA-binding transcriptional MocR family regulator